MILPLAFEEFTLPIENPVLKFLIILAIILFAPLVFNRIKIPHILGLILAGAIVGPYGFNLVLRDDGIILSGTAGLLYIMFLAGLEIDLNEFKRNSVKSIIFGLFSFAIPLGLGFLTGLYVLKFNYLASLLLGSMFASHTLITYPIISKMGVKRNRAVTITLGGTLIADTLALLVLAVVVGLSKGAVDLMFWIRLTCSVLLFGTVVLVGFPIIARLFFKRVTDGLSQYIFVLFLVFLGAAFAELAGIEHIIGAFLVGLSLSRLIPHSSALMNRIEFIGNAIFIPFFLIGVGMLIDYKAFISSWGVVSMAIIITVVATVSKFLAAYFTQKSFGFTADERRVIFGLSNARVAAALAAVLVGVDLMFENSPLIDSNLLNATIIMIFLTCTIASFSAQKGAHQLSLESVGRDEDKDEESDHGGKILLAIHHGGSIDEMVGFANLISHSGNHTSFVTVANIINSEDDEQEQLDRAKNLFDSAVHTATAADMVIDTCLRYDTSYTHGIQNLIREHGVTDLLLDLDPDKFLKSAFLSKFADTEVVSSGVTTYLYRPFQPLQTVKRYVIIVPPHAERELGFRAWLTRVWGLLHTTSSSAVIYADSHTRKVMASINEAMPINVVMNDFSRYSDLLIISKELRKDDALIFVLSRRSQISYEEHMEQIPYYINNYFTDMNFVLIYPQEHSEDRGDMEALMNPTSAGAVSRIESIVEGIASLIHRRENN